MATDSVEAVETGSVGSMNLIIVIAANLTTSNVTMKTLEL